MAQKILVETWGDTDKKEVETLLKKFPLYPYFERIEMTLVEQSF